MTCGGRATAVLPGRVGDVIFYTAPDQLDSVCYGCHGSRFTSISSEDNSDVKSGDREGKVVKSKKGRGRGKERGEIGLSF